MWPVILRIAASNALSAIILAAVVAAVSLLVARPALTRALWVLVLLKLLTPPLWTIPVDDLLGHRANDRDVKSAPGVSDSEVATAAGLEERIQGDLNVAANTNNSSGKLDVRYETAMNAPISGSSSILDSIPAADWIAVIWGAGTLGCLTALVVRVRRFLRCLKLAAPAAACVQRRCAARAAQLGLRSSPGVWFLRSALCPSLWAFSRPARLLVPPQLWDRLDTAQQDALLVHELAHLRRRDHWVRLLETAATLVYWWHPVVWFARRRLHEAEEQCCDAWVLGILPAAGKSYAAALLQTVDFISTARPATPALASGLGEFTCLKRRIVMIQNGSVRKALTRSGAVVVFCLASVVLPLAVGFGQVGPEKEAKPENALEPAASNKERFQEHRVSVHLDAVEKPGDDRADQSNLETDKAIKQVHAEVDQLCAERDKIDAAISAAKERWRALEKARVGETRFHQSIAKPEKPRDFNRLSVSRSDASPTDRLDRLEKQVNSILAEIHELKSQQHEPVNRE